MKTIYKADDGTEFDQAADCRNYEERKALEQELLMPTESPDPAAQKSFCNPVELFHAVNCLMRRQAKIRELEAELARLRGIQDAAGKIQAVRKQSIVDYPLADPYGRLTSGGWIDLIQR